METEAELALGAALPVTELITLAGRLFNYTRAFVRLCGGAECFVKGKSTGAAHSRVCIPQDWCATGEEVVCFRRGDVAFVTFVLVCLHRDFIHNLLA